MNLLTAFHTVKQFSFFLSFMLHIKAVSLLFK